MENVLIIIMITGIVFYAALLVFYFLGKNSKNSTGKVQDFALGKVSIKASEFIVLSLISAIFIISPLVYNYYNQKDERKVVSGTSKQDAYEFVVRGRAVDDEEKVKSNVLIRAEHLRNDSLVAGKSSQTDIEGHYEFRFKNPRRDDLFRITWSEPDNKPKSRDFYTNEISYVVKISKLSN